MGRRVICLREPVTAVGRELGGRFENRSVTCLDAPRTRDTRAKWVPQTYLWSYQQASNIDELLEHIG